MTAISHKLTCTTPGRPGQWFGILLLAVAGLGVPAESQAQELDRAALVAFYNATDGDSWTHNTNWLSSLPIGEWDGVVTDHDGRVTAIQLINNNLTGPIPPELGPSRPSGTQDGLSNLEFLRLNNNNLTGPLPSTISYLRNLRWLYIENNAGLCAPADAEFQAWLATLLDFGGDTCADEEDRAALVALYNATYGANWYQNQNWLSSAPIGEWYGVVTDSNGRVTELRLYENSLYGSIPSSLGSLSNLKRLVLYDNSLDGSIPSSLGNLTNLVVLSLSDNYFTGSIPSSLGSLSNLVGLGLFENRLDGSIPSSLGNLTNLEYLELQYNQLTGSIPSSLGSLSNLVGLGLQYNQLDGSIPSSLGSLSNLDYLVLFENQLTGSIPSSLGNLSNLEGLYLAENQLTGSIPSSLGNLTNLERLYLNENQLTGSIPSSLGNLTNLERLYLNENQLTGSIPSSLGSLSNLVQLNLSRNQLTGSIPGSFGNLTHLDEVLNLSRNQLTGPLPSSMTNLQLLNALFINDNAGLCAPADAAFQAWLARLDFNGDICAEEADRAALVALYNATDGANWDRNQNWLSSAPIGEWYGVTTDNDGRVTSLSLDDDNLTGPIPPELGRLSNLHTLHLESNNLTGPIPPELGDLTNIKVLGLIDNNLTGPVLPELGRLSNLVHLWLHANNLTGPVPPELGRLSNLYTLHLGSNNLTGPVPPELGRLSNLNTLSLHTNNLTGPVPPEWGDLANLETLILYENNLTGPLPSSMTNLRLLDSLHIKNNAGLCAPADAAFQAWLATVGNFTGDTCADAVQPKPPDKVQANVDAAVAASGGLRAGGPPVTIEMNTLFSFGDGGSVDTAYTARSSQPALVMADTTGGSLVLTPGDPQAARAPSNLVGGAADTTEGTPERVTITVTATRADDTAEVAFTVEVESEAEPVPVLPLLGQLLLALGLLAGGVRQARHWAR